MEPRLTLVTLGVADLDRSVAFYRDVIGWPPATVLDDVAFFDLGGTMLAVWRHEALAAELGVEPVAPAYRAIAMAHNLRSRAAVDAAFADLRERGARIVREPAGTEWGGYSGYIEDPDGHRWEIAHNPGWPLDDHGRVRLPDG
jgi:catechol 2,3-dioxygenase-like lactoylglutathione lyase family enzyme